MKRTAIIVLSIALLASVLSAQVYLGGRGRLTGLVMDQTGQPIDGVTVKLFAVKHQDGFSVKTGKDGKWAATMLSGGDWNVDFEKPGYAPFKTSVTVKELERLPEIKVVLQKIEGLVLTDELKKLLGDANQLFEQKNYPAALEGYNAIMAKYPDAYIIWQNVGNAHFAQEQYDKAEEAYRRSWPRRRPMPTPSSPSATAISTGTRPRRPWSGTARSTMPRSTIRPSSTTSG